MGARPTYAPDSAPGGKKAPELKAVQRMEGLVGREKLKDIRVPGSRGGNACAAAYLSATQGFAVTPADPAIVMGVLHDGNPHASETRAP